jgi:endonuclease/exonuclease/phosphatase family metal-dependent hydrolase
LLFRIRKLRIGCKIGLMEILSWNIMSGGFNSYDSLANIPDRLSLLVSKIRSINADFVGLVDTHRWTEVFRTEDLIRLFGYENVYSVKLEDERLKSKGHDNGVTVLTRLPVKKFETIRIFSRNAIKTSLEDVDILTTYLDDLSEDTRLLQCDSLLSWATSGVPTVIIGDLNTMDESDLVEVESLIKEMLIQHPEEKAVKATLKGMMRGEVTKKLKENGFIDMGKGQGNTVPTKLFPIKVDQPIARIDYGFCTPNIKAENFEVLRDKELDLMSDHFPIKMTVELK